MHTRTRGRENVCDIAHTQTYCARVLHGRRHKRTASRYDRPLECWLGRGWAAARYRHALQRWRARPSTRRHPVDALSRDLRGGSLKRQSATFGPCVRGQKILCTRCNRNQTAASERYSTSGIRLLRRLLQAVAAPDARDGHNLCAVGCSCPRGQRRRVLREARRLPARPVYALPRVHLARLPSSALPCTVQPLCES